MLALCLTALVAAPADATVGNAPPAGFKALFDGKSLAGWRGWAIHDPDAAPAAFAKLTPERRAALQAKWTADAQKHWSVRDGELVNDGQGAYLATAEDFGDVELLIEYRTVAKADSGVYLRATPQVQIWDATDPGKFPLGADKGSGGLWNNSPKAPGKDPLAKMDRPFGEWNQLRILQVGERTTVLLNGTLVVDHARMENFWDRAAPLAAAGAVLLQTHGGEIRWRNVFARAVPAAEANRLLVAKAAAGAKPLFDGKTLANFAGATADYEVKAGAIVCKPGQGGVLRSAEKYADFAAVVEYTLPPGGNNGLAVRYPGAGDPSVSGMCEVQILDDTAKQYAKLDPRQYNGSVYGMVPAARGYLRPAGEKNVIVVTAVGSAIECELNGTRITKGDVAKVTEFMGGKPHPGKDLPEGYFGFAGHGDPVAFHQVIVRPLAK